MPEPLHFVGLLLQGVVEHEACKRILGIPHPKGNEHPKSRLVVLFGPDKLEIVDNWLEVFFFDAHYEAT
jgi:hypothetical protein